jgi:hypothetical protein
MVMPSLKMTPAPMKPMPLMMFDAMRSGEVLAPSLRDRIVKIVEPRQISVMVRKPAALLRYSRSPPMMPPMTRAATIRVTVCRSALISILIPAGD